MVEAMAARLAVVVSRVGAIPEPIDDRRNGLLVEPRNTDSLAARAGGNRRRWCTSGKPRSRGLRIATREFEVEAAVNRLVAEIEDTIVAGREHRLSGRVQ